MKEQEKIYRTTKEQCQKTIDEVKTVCDGCGGVIEPIETVDNSGNPTYWAGCLHCSKFTYGALPEIYQIAVKMVDDKRFIAWHHMDMPGQNSTDSYRKYYRESQISGTCGIVRDVLTIKASLEIV